MNDTQLTVDGREVDHAQLVERQREHQQANPWVYKCLALADHICAFELGLIDKAELVKRRRALVGY